MLDKIRTAVIGTSWWADGAHLPGLRARGDVELVALCGRNPDRLAAIAGKFNIPLRFTDYKQMLAEARPEVVVVVTPNAEHAPMTLAALDAGAHVLCEKPLALTADDAARMLERAEQLNRRHMCFFSYRGVAATRYVKQLVDSGYLGRLHHAQACYLHGSWLDPNRPANWKTLDARGGGGVLGDLGTHVIDLLQWWFGPIARATGSFQTLIKERPRGDGTCVPVLTEDAAAFVVEFEQGGHATGEVSRIAPLRKNYQRFELYGSDGALVFEYEKPLAYVGQLSGAKANEGELKPLPIPRELSEGLAGDEGFTSMYRALTDSFFASVRGGGPSPSPNFVDGLAAQRVVDAIARSGKSGLTSEKFSGVDFSARHSRIV